MSQQAQYHLQTSRSYSAKFQPATTERSSSSGQSWLCSRYELARRTAGTRQTTTTSWSSATCTAADQVVLRNWCVLLLCCHVLRTWGKHTQSLRQWSKALTPWTYTAICCRRCIYIISPPIFNLVIQTSATLCSFEIRMTAFRLKTA